MNQESGVLYFIYSQKGFKDIASGNDFAFDVTYLDSKDSLTLNFTYKNKLLLEIDSIVVKMPESVTASPANKIFIETKKSDWVYRYGTILSFDDLYTFFANPDPLPVWIVCKEQKIELDMSSGTWKKQAPVYVKIMDLIRTNKK